jgi:hypothetical protein
LHREALTVEKMLEELRCVPFNGSEHLQPYEMRIGVSIRKRRSSEPCFVSEFDGTGNTVSPKPIDPLVAEDFFHVQIEEYLLQ